MDKNIKEITLQILEKHLNSNIFVIYTDGSSLFSEHGILKACDKISLTFDSFTKNTKNRTLKFIDDKGFHIRHIYNSNFLDIFTTGKTETLAMKLRDKISSKWIINNLKTSLNEEVNVIAKVNQSVNVLRGQMSDMGISGLKLKTPPYYNTEEILDYSIILNVYNLKLTDLTNI